MENGELLEREIYLEGHAVDWLHEGEDPLCGVLNMEKAHHRVLICQQSHDIMQHGVPARLRWTLLPLQGC